VTPEGTTTLERIRRRVRQGHFQLSKHATRQMDVRGRTLEEVQLILLEGEIIRHYPDEQPYPEWLFLGYPGGPEDPCYVVVASNDETVIVTVHNYDPEVYEADHRTRRSPS